MTPPPLVILSGHRTGSSAVAGLLHLSGLHMGDLVPPSPDNQRGYFENAAILDASRRMLAARTRDWTCPPQHFSPNENDLALAEQALSGLAHGPVWGFKDPRTMFLLPTWLQLLPQIRLIGVRRSSEATAKSINVRDRIPLNEATRIAELYDDRLHQLGAALGFPIVDFGSELTSVLTSVREIVDQVEGLTWKEEEAADFLDLSLVHHESASRDETRSSVLVDLPSAIVTRAVNSLVVREEEPARIHGPAYRWRIDLDWRAASSARSEAGLVLDLVPDRRVQPPIFESNDAVEITREELRARTTNDGRVSHVVATDMLESIPPEDLSRFLSELHTATDDDGVIVLSGYVVDDAYVPPRRHWPAADLNTFMDHPPYLHHRSLVEAAILISTWYLGSVSETPGGRTQLVLVKSAERRDSTHLTAQELRTVHPKLEDEIEYLNQQLHIVNATRDDLAKTLETTRKTKSDLEKELQLQRATVEAIRSELTSQRGIDQANVKRLVETQERLGRVASERDQARASNKSLGAQVKKTRRERDAARRDLKKLRGRRSVRMALGVAAAFRPLFRFVRRTGGREKAAGVKKKSLEEAQSGKDASAAAALIKRLRPNPGPETGDLVSIVVTTRNGCHHLQRLLPGLENNTNYRSFELIVVDNGSSDSTSAYLQEPFSFPVRVISNEANQSFSAANNQGIRAAKGEYVLLLNNDIEPINAGWLGAMLTTLQDADDVGAVGALLVYPDRPESATEVNYPGLTVQHRGITFGWKNDHPWAMNLGGGEDPTRPELTGSWDVPAATAACLLMRRSGLEDLGLLDEGYTYGSEDVDLCLRIRELGSKIRLCGDAALFHYEFGTQDTLAREVKRINRTGNERRFVEAWGPRLRRSIQSDSLANATRWTEKRPPTVAITLTKDDRKAGWGDWYTAHELGEAFAAAGWDVLYAERFNDHWYELPEDLDVIVSLLDSFDVRRAPRGTIKIAWIRNWLERWMEHPWFEHFDEIATSSSLAADQIAQRTRYRPHLVPIATNPRRFSPGESDPTFESDFVFTGNFWGEGRSLIDQLLLRPEERFLLFGKGWERVPRAQRYWRGQLDYERLPAVYRSAHIVLDDTASPTLPHGFLNSRVFDAIASGTLVITDNRAGSEDLFGGALPSYETRDELRRLMDLYNSDATLRRTLTAELREVVVQRHTYERRAEEFAGIARESVATPRLALKIGPPSWEEAPAWGDTHFATQFARALGKKGFATEVHVLSEWDDPDKQDVDVVVHIRGLTPYVPKPAHFNIMWIISHPDDVSDEECERYDMVLVASEAFANQLGNRVDVPVHTMLQATDTTLFTPGTSEPPKTGPIVFVGNSRGEYRKAVRWAIEQDLPLDIYGGDWDDLLGIGKSNGTVPNAELPSLYQSATVLLNDHWDDMAQQGFVSNRIFDALACGAFVVSDHVAGMENLFGDIVPTYSDPDELRAVVERYANDHSARRKLTAKGAALVAEKHSFGARANEFIALVGKPLNDRRAGIEPELGSLGEDTRRPRAEGENSSGGAVTTIPQS